MKIVAALVLIALVAFVVARRLFGSRQSGSWVDPNDSELAAAEAQAKASLPDFLRRLEQPGPGETDFMLKFRLRSGGEAEQIWAEEITKRDGRIYGRLGNRPISAGYSEGQEVEIPPGDILDWGYRAGEVMQGHFSTRALMPRMPRETAAHIRRQFGWDRAT